jgi:anti-sigma regulatory factor (Ser/Thr protein kinase)
MESTARLALDGAVVDPLHARRFTKQQLADWNVPFETCEVAELLVCELVSNAVRYAPGPIVVEIEMSDDLLRVVVEDRAADALPVPSELPQHAVTGRGLIMLAALARAWGSRPVDDGKQVWFELATA